jgi:hypothetical protein
MEPYAQLDRVDRLPGENARQGLEVVDARKSSHGEEGLEVDPEEEEERLKVDPAEEEEVIVRRW